MFEGHPIRERLRRWSRELPGSRWFVVGGAVRDAMLGRPLKDVDVLVAGVEPAALARFLEARGSVSLVGRTFGVFKFAAKDGGLAVDIALPRTERPFGTGGYRDLEARFDADLPVERDLARRDFTVNAMAWDAVTEEILDPHGGREDLGRKTIRAVGDPAERFAEDLTRVLRGLRFAAELGFALEPFTRAALRAAARRLDETRDGERLVPHEIVARELLKSLAGDPKRAYALWREAGAFEVLLPNVRFDRDPSRRLALIGAGHAEAALAGLLYDDGAPYAAEAARKLRLSSAAGFGVTPERLARTIVLASQILAKKAADWRPSALRHAFLEDEAVGHDALRLADALGAHAEAYERRLAEVRKRAARPVLDGKAVMLALELKPGPDIGKIIDLLIDAQAEGKVSSPSEARAWLTSRLHT